MSSLNMSSNKVVTRSYRDVLTNKAFSGLEVIAEKEPPTVQVSRKMKDFFVAAEKIPVVVGSQVPETKRLAGKP